MESTYSLADLVKVLLSNWKKIALVTLLGTLVGVAVALLKPDYYKASTVFYPASEDLTKYNKLFGGDKNINYYGGRQDLDRLITIGESGRLKQELIRKFNLFDRYDIDSTSTHARHKVLLKLLKLYNLKRTEYDALELTVEDKDPFVSAEMANYSREMIESLSAEVIKGSQKGNMDKLAEAIVQDQQIVITLRDSLSYLRKKYNIYNNQAQAEHLSESVGETQSNLAQSKARLKYYKNHTVSLPDSIMTLEARVLGYEEKLRSLTRSSGGYFNLQSFREGLPQFEQVTDMYAKQLGQLNYGQILFNQMNQVYSSDIPMIQLVEEASVPLIKSRPFRSLIVIGASLLAMLLCILFIIINEYWRLSSK